MANPFLNSGSGSFGNPFGPAPDTSTPKKKKKKKPKATRKQVETLLRAAQKGDMVTFDYIASSLKLTPTQRAVALKAAEREDSGEDRSFGDKLKGIGGAALGGASWTLDKIMRPSYASVNAIDKIWDARDEAREGDLDLGDIKDIGIAAKRGFMGEEKKGMGQVFEEHGVLKGHRRLRGTAGFIADVMTDPTMALSVAAAPVTGGGSVAAYTAAKQSGTQLSKRALARAAQEAGQRAIKGETDDVIEELLKAGGKKYEHRLGLHNLNKSLKEQTQNVMQMGHNDLLARTREIHAGQRMAYAESRMYDPRKISFILGTGKHHLRIPTGIPIITRPGAKISEREIPVVSQLSDKMGKAFIPGFKNDILRAGSLARQQAGEFNAVVHRDAAQRILAGIDEKLDPDEMLDALHFMEQPLKRGKGHWKAVVKDKSGEFTLNQQYLDTLQEQGLLTDIQREFVERFHHVTNYLHAADMSVGLRYDNFGETGRMYVPHITKPDVDTLNVTQSSLLTQAGFEHGRKAVLSLRQMKDLAAEGHKDLDIFEYDPLMALARRSRAGAERQADKALINTLKSSIGVPTRLVDEKQVKGAEARIDAATKKWEGAQRVAAAAEQELDNKVAQLRDELGQIYDAAKLSAGKTARQTLKTQKQQRIKKLEDEIAALKAAPKAAPKGKAPRAAKAKPEAAPKAPSELAGFRPAEQKAIQSIAKARKELDQLDKAHAPGTDLPDFFKGVKRPIKGTRTLSRRDSARAYLDRAEERILKRRRNREVYQAERAATKPAKAKAPAAAAKLARAAKPVEPVKAVSSKRRGKAWHANVMRGTRKVGSVWQEKTPEGTEWVAMIGRKEGPTLGPFKSRKDALKAVDAETAPKVAPAPKPRARSKSSSAPTKAASPSRTPSTAGRIKELEAEIRRIKSSKYGDRLTAQTEREVARMEKEYERALTALDRPGTRAFSKLLGEDAVTYKTAKEVLQESKREITNAQKALSRARKGKHNRKFGPNHYASSEVDEFGNAWAFPKEAKQTILRLERLISGEDQAVMDFAKGWGKFMGSWKILMTSVNPGYRLRNSATDYWNMWVAGVPSAKIAQYGAKAARVMIDVKKMDDPIRMQRAFNTLQEASDHGIMSGLFAGDVQAVAQMFKHAQRSKRSLMKNGKFIQLYTKIAGDVNRNAENWGRLTHYMYRREHLGESAAEAAFRVKIAHFDYEDITEFERKLKFTAFPFYTWTRKNIPYQVRQIMARPGRYSAFPKMAQEAEYAAGDEEDRVPGYMSKNFAVSLPFGTNKFLMPQFGVSDLAVFESTEGGLDRVKSLLGPQFKVPAEIITGKSTFTGQPIEPEFHERVPFSGRGAGLLDLIPGTNVGQTSRVGPGGTDVDTPGMDPWAAWAIGQVPMARTAFGIGAGTQDKQNQQLLSYLGGLGTQTVDPEMQAYYERLGVQDQVSAMTAALRDRGKIARTDKSKTNFEKMIEDILSGDY